VEKVVGGDILPEEISTYNADDKHHLSQTFYPSFRNSASLKRNLLIELKEHKFF
jgi:hypothetical protein